MQKLSRRLSMLAGVAALAFSSQAFAAETGGCDSFAWSITTALQWLQAADSEQVASGSTLKEPPSKAISLALLPMDKVSFPVAPTSRRKSTNGDRFGGFMTFDSAGDRGIYQVSLPMAGWVDVIQGGKAIRPAAHTGKMDCEGVRKSVRFSIGAGPVTIEISGIPKDSVKFTFRRGE